MLIWAITACHVPYITPLCVAISDRPCPPGNPAHLDTAFRSSELSYMNNRPCAELLACACAKAQTLHVLLKAMLHVHGARCRQRLRCDEAGECPIEVDDMIFYLHVVCLVDGMGN